jgi:hypothetical protein
MKRDGFTTCLLLMLSVVRVLWKRKRSFIHALFEEPLNSQKVSVFCALSQRRIIGPTFFDTTVTSQVYIELFREFVNQMIRNSHLVITNKMGPQATLLA